jgi:DNA topoisomerase-1
MKNLVIVESPPKAKKIQKYLGAGWRVVASLGHVRDLPPKALGVDVGAGFVPTYEVSRGKGKVIKKIRDEARTATAIYLATDPDREGEAIAWHVLESVGAAVRKKPIYRVTFTEITQKAIRAAFKRPRKLDMALINSQQARRILDRLVGWKVSPVLRHAFGVSLSAGRVQSVAVRLVVERELEIESFQSEQSWTLDARFARQTANRSEFRARLAALLMPADKELEAKRLPTERVHAIRAELSSRQILWQVIAIQTKQTRRRPPPPFITSTLQQKASSVLKMKPRRAMQIAQKLYEKGLITYMRTDSPAVSKSAQKAAREVIASIFGPHTLPDKPPYYRAKGNAQEAHECIRPTNPTLLPKKAKLAGQEAALYRLIWMRFIASQMKPAQYDLTVVTIQPSQEWQMLPYQFEARGRVLRDPGWLTVYNVARTNPNDMDDRKKDDDEDSQVLPPLQEGEQVDLRKLGANEHWTKPPSRYTEPSLIKELEKAGGGRPSTYASIMDTIQKRGYVEVKKKSLVPTQSGRAVTGFLVAQFPKLLDIGFTKQMEDNLDRVAEGQVAWQRLLTDFYRPLAERIVIAKQAAKAVPTEETLAKPCPKCGTTLETLYSRYGKYEQCPFCGYKPNAAQETGQSCPECARPLLKRKGRFGFFIGCSGYPECRYIIKSEKSSSRRKSSKRKSKANLDAANQPCPQCGKQLIVKKGRYGKFVACSGYPECKYIHKEGKAKGKG